jgi:hypothetical protein
VRREDGVGRRGGEEGWGGEGAGKSSKREGRGRAREEEGGSEKEEKERERGRMGEKREKEGERARRKEGEGRHTQNGIQLLDQNNYGNGVNESSQEGTREDIVEEAKPEGPKNKEKYSALEG